MQQHGVKLLGKAVARFRAGAGWAPASPPPPLPGHLGVKGSYSPLPPHQCAHTLLGSGFLDQQPPN